MVLFVSMGINLQNWLAFIFKYTYEDNRCVLTPLIIFLMTPSLLSSPRSDFCEEKFQLLKKYIKLHLLKKLWNNRKKIKRFEKYKKNNYEKGIWKIQKEIFIFKTVQ